MKTLRVTLKTYEGRPIIERIEFTEKGTWNALHAAERYVTGLGCEYGSLCCPMPLGFMKGEYNLPWKWKNMSRGERKSVDGIVIGEYREGPVSVLIFNPVLVIDKQSILNVLKELE